MQRMPTLQRTSLAELVYQRLLNLILSGEIPSGSDVNLSDISRDLGVSSIPVREAVLRLSCEGLIHCETNRRATVVEFDLDTVLETFQLREFLEAGAASLAAERISNDGIDRLESIDRQIQNSNDLEEAFALENEFHGTLVRASGNSLLTKHHQCCLNRIAVIRVNGRKTSGVNELLPFQSHREILDGLHARCPQTAEQAVREHIRAAVAKLTLSYSLTAR